MVGDAHFCILEVYSILYFYCKENLKIDRMTQVNKIYEILRSPLHAFVIGYISELSTEVPEMGIQKGKLLILQ